MPCFRCGRESHQVKHCTEKTRVDGSVIPLGFPSGGDSTDPQGPAHLSRPCTRCGRENHAAAECYASTLVSSSAKKQPSSRGGGGERDSFSGPGPLPPSSTHTFTFNFPKDVFTATSSEDAEGGNVHGSRNDEQPGAGSVAASLRPCGRCGRASHSAAECYAATRVDGTRIAATSSNGQPSSSGGGGSSSSIGSPAPLHSRPATCFFCDAPGHSVYTCPLRAPGGARDPPPKDRRVCNIQGSSLSKHWQGSSWKSALEDVMGGPLAQCVALDCDGPAEVGAHVWLEGDRRRYYIAGFCEKCNHRHGDEELCYCRFIGKGEDPKRWIPIKDSWMMKIAGPDSRTLPFEDFKAWCREKGPVGEEGHGYREMCCQFCKGRGITPPFWSGPG